MPNSLASRLDEGDPLPLDDTADGVARHECPFQQLLRQRILQVLLDRPLQRPRAVDRIVADAPEPVACRIGQVEADPSVVNLTAFETFFAERAEPAVATGEWRLAPPLPYATILRGDRDLRPALSGC